VDADRDHVALCCLKNHHHQMVGATIDHRRYCDSISCCRIGEAALSLADNALGHTSFDRPQDEAVFQGLTVTNRRIGQRVLCRFRPSTILFWKRGLPSAPSATPHDNSRQSHDARGVNPGIVFCAMIGCRLCPGVSCLTKLRMSSNIGCCVVMHFLRNAVHPYIIFARREHSPALVYGQALTPYSH
jgi:hypothetical protein